MEPGALEGQPGEGRDQVSVSGAAARKRATLVAIDQITSASTPGKKPKPNRLSSPRPERTAANATRNPAAPMSATTPVQRAKTPDLRVRRPAARRSAAKPIAESR